VIDIPRRENKEPAETSAATQGRTALQRGQGREESARDGSGGFIGSEVQAAPCKGGSGGKRNQADEDGSRPF